MSPLPADLPTAGEGEVPSWISQSITTIGVRLIGDNMRGTIRTSLLTYDQLWAFCARNFVGLSSFTPRKEAGRAKPSCRELNPVLLQRLARFVAELGFRTPKALELANLKSQSQLAIEYLRMAYPNGVTFSEEQIRRVTLAASSPPTEKGLSTPSDSNHIKLERRCGQPFVADYLEDKLTLFIPKIYAEGELPDVTLQFVRRDIFYHVFGLIELREQDLEPNDSVMSGLGTEQPGTNQPEITDNSLIADLGTKQPETIDHYHTSIMTELVVTWLGRPARRFKHSEIAVLTRRTSSGAVRGKEALKDMAKLDEAY
ncbi:hypothetical protein GQ43DRAFT_431402 [Delitschia confertaspora ATCC 74209]|uniref:Uncharacterized protein n=1 Tax=Delitschia confertaspora ATCC 74209 TaxID=1513339 RepID=A0A9P4JNZ3_9PLEO|nr:hypothetical protein GQ43DRAFT_431402 [Delitschia confertaspora ATCC 74209]